MNEAIEFAFGDSSLAAFLAARSDTGVVAIIIHEQLDRDAMIAALRHRFPKAALVESDTALADVIDTIASFVDDPHETLSLPLDIRGTDFQRAVYAEVLRIPFGTTLTFSEIARRIGRPGAARAAGSACTRNPLEFAIPCHRALRSDGRWAGGGDWGDYRQSQLVERERRNAR